MIKLSDRKWKSFFIYDVFEHRRGERQVAEQRIKGDVPYYSASDSNNGLTDMISNPSFTFDKPAIIYTTFGDAYYVNPGFSASDEITILYNDHINRYVGIFISNCLINNKSKYSFGRKAFSKKIRKDRIMLPINNQNEPDYNFMEAYTKEKEMVFKQKQIEFIKKKLLILGESVPIAKLSKCVWQPYKIKDIFPSVRRGKRLKTEDHIIGDIPYVSSTALNNGVDRFIGNDKQVRKYGDCLSLANSGSVGSCFYEPFEFIASDHVTHLKRQGLTPYQYLFMANMANRLSEKYNFNREINDKRISRETILLPTKDGQPDYEYMEQYIKNILIKKYNQYLTYLQAY